MRTNRERHDYNGAVTRLTEADWAIVARNAGRRGAGDFLIVLDGQTIAEGSWLKVVGHFFLNLRAGQSVKMVARKDHEDYVQRVAEAVLSA